MRACVCVYVLDIHLGHSTGVKENDRADRLAGKATNTSGLRLGILNGVEELETPAGCRHKAKDITPSVAWRKEPRTEEALHNLL